MKKTILLTSFLTASALGAFAQNEYVKQYFFTSGGVFFGKDNKVKVGVVKDNKVQYIDSVPGDFSNDVNIYYNKKALRYEGIAHIGGGMGTDILMRYDLDSYSRLDSTTSTGVKAFDQNNEKIVVAKAYGSSGANVEILDANTLDLLVGIDEITNPTSDVKVLGDSAFVSHSLLGKTDVCPGTYVCFDDSLGYISVINLKNNQLVNTIALGAKGAGVKNLILRREADNRIHVYFKSADSLYISEGNLAIHNMKGVQPLAITNDNIIGIQQTSPLLTGVKTDKFFSNKTTTLLIQSKNFLEAAYDTVNNLYLILKSDYSSFGRLVRYNARENQVQDSSSVGVSSSAIQVDYRPGVSTSFATLNEDKATFDISPNPCKDHLLLNDKNAAFTMYEIRNMEGKMLANAELDGLENRINTEFLARGIYLLTLKGSTKEQTLKIIKE